MSRSAQTLGDFARYLERVGELHRVSVEVDPCLEITEIASRAVREGKPALWFERVRGSAFPLIINTLASDRRCELALGKHPEQLGEELISFLGDLFPPRPSAVWRQRAFARRFLHAPVRRVRSGISQEVVEEPDLDALPVLTCWPGDGGRFFTLPQVVTYDPRNGKRNMGMYRMQVFDARTTGMHWQIQKGGGFHYYQAEKLQRPFELAVALGTDPALLMATIAALPENIDEAMFAGFLRGRRTEFAPGVSVGIDVPAHAEFVLEGDVPLFQRRREGPFGDHFGHYSHAADFPFFRVRRITRRRDAVYPATVVGIPPMEDKFLGDATQLILGPLARLVHAEVSALWAYYEAGFHNLLVVAVDQRYAKEAVKTALGLMGLAQLALSKTIILVSEGVNVRDFSAVLKEVRDNFDPHFDFVLIPRAPLDTLDFTSFTMNLGSRMILDATRKPMRPPRPPSAVEPETRQLEHLRTAVHGINDLTLVDGTLLLVKTTGGGKDLVETLVRHPDVRGVRIVAAVSDDVDIRDPENRIWGLFTRFDCERDVVFTEARMIGISPVYGGVMGIDATWKPGYPEPLRMADEVRRKVEERWDSYWR
ncbi:MAG TPA: UbiD family decarboxylase [Bacteroidota bacterium]